MNRRGFLGGLVAAPAVAKEIAATHIAGGIPVSDLYNTSGPYIYTNSPPESFDMDKALRAAYKAGLITKEQIAERICYPSVEETRLDFDLRSYKSFSLSAKAEIQRRRNQERAVNNILFGAFTSENNSLWDLAKKFESLVNV